MQTDTALPRDVMIITPHFNVSSGTPDPDTLAGLINDKMAAWLTVAAPVTTKIYATSGPPPHHPLANKTKNPAGAPIVSSAPREIALCLSYYSLFNSPGDRGRLYIPLAWITKATGGGVPLSMRPAGSHQSSVMLLVTDMFKSLTTAGAQWGFWSTSDNAFKAVTNYYVDDEWDTVRKRGLRPTGRVAGVA